MKTMTVNRLHKALGKLIEDGHGRLPVCVNKDTFQHNLEGDGCVILPVNHVLAQHVLQIDDDGGTKTDSKGRECYRHNVVLLGDAADADGKYEPAIRPEPSPAFVAMREALEKIEWTDHWAGGRFCTWCGGLENVMHTPGCVIGSALALAEKEAGTTPPAK